MARYLSRMKAADDVRVARLRAGVLRLERIIGVCAAIADPDALAFVCRQVALAVVSAEAGFPTGLGLGMKFRREVDEDIVRCGGQ